MKPALAKDLLGQTPGSWASVSGGKWHLTVSSAPDWRRDETALCGVTFRPLNVTHSEAPPTNEHWLCKKCLARKPPIA